jgi:putative nucleotidyltransferase with HDIG domain
MAHWWLKLMALFGREPQARESKGGLRGTGKGSAKGGAKGAAAETPHTDRPGVWLLGAGLVVLLLHLIMFPPAPQFTADFPRAGEIAGAEIRAPFSFESSMLEQDVQMKRLERVLVEPPVMRILADDGQVVRMEQWLGQLAIGLAADSLDAGELAELLSLQFPDVSASEALQLVRSDQPDSLVSRLTRAWQRIEAGGVADMLPTGRYDRVVIIGPQAEVLRDRDRVVSQANLEGRLTAELRSAGMAPLEAVAAAKVLRHFIRPSLVYDPEQTAGRQETARQAVPTRRDFISGERIVDQGVRVTEQQVRHLDDLAALLQSRGEGEDRGGRTVRYLTRSLLLVLALGVYGWLGRIHFPRELRRRRVVVALTVVLVLFMAGASLALEKPALGPLAVPIVLLSLLTTVLFKDKIGYTTTLLALTLLAVLPGLVAAPVFVWFVLGMVTVVSVRRIHKRSQFYQTILLLTALSVVLIFLLGGEVLGQHGGNIYVVGLFASILSVALGLFLLPVVEPLVGVCSDLTLLELSDLNHPLLQRMALEAQGTYHHSQVVGQLAEHAARAIDANALLTRVGALFHDIGKMQKSEYYVENQRPDYNKHNELSPSMSALVIAAHVKDGIELGRKWRLPQMIIDFIPEHHGTMVMEYFYHKALEADGNETVKVDDFRYPGPKPQSRETAILMLADAMEAATRSLAKPTPSRIKEMTKQILDKRMLSGELDESKVSLSDIARIRESFIPLLVGIHHARIVYPNQGERSQGERSQGERSLAERPAADRHPEKPGDRRPERKPRS